LFKVKKRDGKIVDYDDSKIFNAIKHANRNSKDKRMNIAQISDVVKEIENYFKDVKVPSVDKISEATENILMKSQYINTAKSYIIYRSEHKKRRNDAEKLMTEFVDLTFKSADEMESRRDNANINTNSMAGSMLKYGTEASKYFIDNYIMPKEFVEAMKEGWIHIHDKDFSNLAWNCIQIDLLKLFHKGFSTGNGKIREPQSIRSYAALACIAIQANQNEQYGGQSIACFDYAMAEGVKKTFKKSIIHQIWIAAVYKIGIEWINLSSAKKILKTLKQIDFNNFYYGETKENKRDYKTLNKTKISIEKQLKEIFNENAELILDAFPVIYEFACRETENETYQAMEAVVHNFNTLHSRAGAQVPFSSLNFGTDTTPEGRLVIEKLLLSVEKGLGNGETPIFPITVFKLKSGINYNEDDINYDLFKLAIRVSAKRLFPNFVNIDAPYNLKYYVPGDPRTEIAAMGCRTRVIGNVNGPQIVTSRGNFSFTTLNLPKMAIESKKDIKEFYKLLDKYMDLAKQQLTWRYNLIGKRHAYNYPFLIGQHIWMDSEKLDKYDTVREVLKHASISIGFCGLAEALVALIGKHHGESEEAQKLGLEIIGHMRKMTDKYTEQTHLNWSLFATPAESTAGTLNRSNQNHYGKIKGVTDREYMTNSSHVPVYYPIRAIDKIKIEAPYHELCNAGAIAYIEMDGDPTKNLPAFEKIVRAMHDYDCTYFAINHANDTCTNCGYVGIIDNECPKCGQKDHIEKEHIKMHCHC